MSKFFKSGSFLNLILVVIFFGSALWFTTGAALAHETRDVDGGKYQFRVGFITEPAYQGLENGLELTVCTGQCTTKPDSNGVLANGLTGAFDTLKAEVIYGPSTMPLTLVAVPYQPGKYNAPFVPTRTGNYSFHIFGTLGTDKIDERFTSSPDTFDSVQELTALQFPDKPGFSQAGSVPPATAGTSTGVAVGGPTAAPAATPATTVAGGTPIAAVAPTASAAAPAGASASDLQALQQQLATQQQALDTAKTNASSANTLGLVGLIVGIIGLVVAALALFMSRSRGSSGSPKPRREIEGG